MTKDATYETRRAKGRRGTVLLLSILVLSLLGALSLALTLLVQKNIASAAFFNAHSDLRGYAESGLAVAMHDLRYNYSGQEGNIGTAGWSVELDDTGSDGLAGTGDTGDGDGIPTPGEPHVSLVDVGPEQLDAGLIVHAFDLGGGLKRLVATAWSSTASTTVEKLARSRQLQIPRVGALLVDPNVSLDLRGNAFLIDGRDHDDDGEIVGSGNLYGVATTAGATPDENKLAILAQIASSQYDQVLGQGGDPSVGEVADEGTDPAEVFGLLRDASTSTLSAGTHHDLEVAAEDGSVPIVYVDGDLHLTGNGSFAGVLVVNGSLVISGQFEVRGFIAVQGDLRLSGGGTSFHTLGGVLVTESITAVDTNDVVVSGSAELLYSSEVLSWLETGTTTTTPYEAVYHAEH